MRAPLFGVLGVLTCAGALGALQACSSSTSNAPASPGGTIGGEDEQRELACSPATDAGTAAAAEAGVTAKILKPTNGQTFSTKDKVPFLGTGSDLKEGSITDKTRMIWNIIDPVKGPTPDGEGPEDTGGPFPAGTYVIRFDVSNKDCLTTADAVTITVQ